MTLIQNRIHSIEIIISSKSYLVSTQDNWAAPKFRLYWTQKLVNSERSLEKP